MGLFKNIKVDIFGASHSDKIGVTISGIPYGTKVNLDYVNDLLERRKSNSRVWSTSRGEADEPIFEKGIEKETAVGDITAYIENKTANSNDYNDLMFKPRPSHADYAAIMKDGKNNFRSGGGRFSGRMTAPLCIAGGIVKGILADKNINIGAYISEAAGIDLGSYRQNDITYSDIKTAHKKAIPVISGNESEVISEIARAKADNDSVGGIIECIVYNMPTGIGDALFDGLEGRIAMSVLAIPGVKGLEFGRGYDITKMKGSEANDPYRIADGKVYTTTNNNGGITGGISNGMPITIRVFVKPTASVGKEQQTVDLEKMENTTISIKGRHDSCIVPRAVPVVEAAVALAIYDCMLDSPKTKNDSVSELSALRQVINGLDAQIASLYKERMSVVHKVAEVKKADNIPIENSERENEIMTRVVSEMPEDIKVYTKELFDTIFRTSKEYQSKFINLE